jgi:hypothetical protein
VAKVADRAGREIVVTKTMSFQKIEQGAAAMVLPGLLLAVFAQDMLSGGAFKGLLATLLVLDLLMIHWLIERNSADQ